MALFLKCAPWPSGKKELTEWAQHEPDGSWPNQKSVTDMYVIVCDQVSVVPFLASDFALRACRSRRTCKDTSQDIRPGHANEWNINCLNRCITIHIHHMPSRCANTVTVNYWMWPNVYKPSCPHWITRYPPTHSGVNECGSCFVLSCWCPSSYEIHGLLFWIIE